MPRRLITFVAVFILALWPGLRAQADWGEDALRVQCSAKSDTIVVEPFIIWNEVYSLHGVDISAIAGKSSLTVSDSIYYRIRGLPETPVQTVCKTSTRDVLMTYWDGKMLIRETADGVTRERQIDLDKETRYAWHVYGPTFRLESNKPDGWSACYGREDGDTSYITGCESWPLSNAP